MASLKDIKRRIKSVKNTKKITYAMKLVSAAKLKRAQDAVNASRAYRDALLGLLARINREQASADFSHPLMEVRSQVKNIRLVVVGGSRGLCGSYNSNLGKRIDLAIEELRAKYPGVHIDTLLLGKKPIEHCRRRKHAIKTSYDALPEDGNAWPIEEVVFSLEKDFLSGEVDQVYLLYTQFRSAMSQTVVYQHILPLRGESLAGELAATSEDVAHEPQETRKVPEGATIFEPSVQSVFEALLPRFLRILLRQAALDSKASEHGSRMVAMDSATTNAGDLIDALTLKHNKLRQSAITAELLDIIGGADAASE